MSNINEVLTTYIQQGGQQTVKVAQQVADAYGLIRKNAADLTVTDAIQKSLADTRRNDKMQDMARNLSNFVDINRKNQSIQESVGQETESNNLANQNMSSWLSKLAFGGMNLNKKTGQLTFGFKRFRMEALSVMFGLQKLSQTIFGLFRPVLDTFGVFKLFRVALISLFAPIISGLMPIFIGIVNFFIGLPKGVKKFIGAVLLGIAIVAALGAALASFLLLFGGLIMMGIFLAALAGITVTGGEAIAILAALAGVMSAVVWALSNTGEVSKQWSQMWENVAAAWEANNITQVLYEALKGTFYTLGALLVGDLMDGMAEAFSFNQNTVTFNDVLEHYIGKFWSG